MGDPIQILVLVLAVTITGLSKGGFAGLGMISTPLLATVMDPLLAVAVMLPVLLVQDAASVFSFRRSVNWRILRQVMPGAVVGIAAGYLLAARVDATVITLVIGFIAMASAGWFLFSNSAIDAPAWHPPGWMGAVCGAASGFASMIAHAGPPPFQIFVLPQKLARDYFVGTSVYFFAMVNLLKLGPYLALGSISSKSLMISAAVIPISLAVTVLGIWLVRRLDPARFQRVILILLALVGVRLTWDGVRALLSAL